MLIKLYHNNSPNNKIGKSLNSEVTYTGSLRDASKIIKPSVMIETESISGYDYAYIPDFDRYYFIKEKTSYRTGLWILDMEVDVLETYADDIKALDCIIEGTEAYGGDTYLDNTESWVTSVKAKTDVLTFSSGLLENGEYILITAGG